MRGIILAAGVGKRMHSNMPKVLHPLCGRPMVWHVVQAIMGAGIRGITVVIGPEGDAVREALADCAVDFAVQHERNGTGRAAGVGLAQVPDTDDVLVACGDMPLVASEFLRDFGQFFVRSNCHAALVAAHMPRNHDFGMVYERDGAFEKIVEQADYDGSLPRSDWANTGIYIFRAAALREGLLKITNTNAQGEYYLTDVPRVLKDDAQPVAVYKSTQELSIFTGINTQAQLADAAGHMRRRINTEHMNRGVRIVDPASVYIDVDVQIAPGAQILPGCIIEGASVIGSNAVAGPQSHITNSIIGSDSCVCQSVVRSSKVGCGVTVGPFAFLRDEARIESGCRIGCFVEIKNSSLGAQTKAAHLSYLGDACVGSNVNIGCGTITCNFDGTDKHPTVIDDGAFIGSNANLVAPVRIGAGAFVAAGSTITHDVPDGALGIARQYQTNKERRISK